MIDPRIALGVQAPNVSNMFENFLNSVQNREVQDQQMKQSAAMLPISLQQGQQAIDMNEQTLASNRDAQRLQNLYQTGQRLKPFLANNDVQGATKFMLDNISGLQSRIEVGENLDLTESMQTLQNLQQGNVQQAMSDINAVEELALGGRTRSAGQREFDNLVSIAQNPNATQLEKDSANRALGNLARVGSSAQERIATSKALGDQVVDQKEDESTATETGKLKAQLKLKPEITKAVDSAKAEVARVANDKNTAKSNAKAMSIYDVGIRNLAKSLGKTTTGPIASLFTGLTDSARTADGAKAIMLPVLKQMFRQSGEGTFTDKDQEVLENMIPTRKDSPETSKAKLEMIDAIVQAKLGGDILTQPSANNPDVPDIDISTASIEELMAERNRLGGQ